MTLRKIVYSYFSKNTLPYWCIVLIDCFFVFFSLLFIYALNTQLSTTVRIFWPHLFVTILIYTALYVIGFKIFRTYSGILRFSSFTDLMRVSYAMLLGLSLSLILKYIVGNHTFIVPIRAYILILSAVCATMLMWGIRVFIKQIYDIYYRRRSAEKAYILGIREGGMAIAKSIRNQDPSKYIVAGFVSSQEEDKDKILMGVSVHAFDKSLPENMRDHNVKALFVSPYQVEALRKHQEMVDMLISNDIKIYMMPSEQQWDGKSDIAHQQMHEVNIEDLLPRQQIQIDLDTIARQLTDKRILITGAAGSIGSEIVRQVASFGPARLILIDQAETPLHDIRLMMKRDFPDIPTETIVADICVKKRMEDIFDRFRPQYVFHAAAYKHVPMMEDNPGESVRNNVEGTRIIADLSVKHGVEKFVMISTDKAVNPTNVMGCSKRICEIYVQSLDKAEKDGRIEGKTQFVTTRFGNVLGSNGSVIPLFHQQIQKGGPVTVTHPDIIRFFMLIPEACKLVLEAGTMGHGGEIFVFDMGEPVKIVDLAKRMIKLSGRGNIEIKYTGLRDGEKLYEEVLNEKETTLPTFHPKIKIAKVREYDYQQVNDDIDRLYKTLLSFDMMEIVKEMKTIVPEFKSQNSIYEKLDK